MSCRETEFGVVACRGGTERPGMMEEYGMPNVLFRLGPRSGDALAWRVPIDDERHASFNLFLNRNEGSPGDEQVWVNEPEPTSTEQAAHAVFSGERTIGDFAERRDFVNVQDSVAQAGQGVIPDRQNERLGHSDMAVIEVRRVWKRELRALAKGRPLKKWTRPANVVVTR
jgi:5,5'-dehydrodivanillate O-demethylase